jgi:hypothetical protein
LSQNVAPGFVGRGVEHGFATLNARLRDGMSLPFLPSPGRFRSGEQDIYSSGLTPGPIRSLRSAIKQKGGDSTAAWRTVLDDLVKRALRIVDGT